MRHHYHYWYGTVVYETPKFLNTLGTIIKAKRLANARKSLDSKISKFLSNNSDAKERRREIHIIHMNYRYNRHRGYIQSFREDIKDYNLDDRIAKKFDDLS